MIRTKSQDAAFQAIVEASGSKLIADAPIAKGGGSNGFGPHELLEAAIAACLNMSVRMLAADRNLKVSEVRSSVTVDRSRDLEATFEYTIEVDSDLSESERSQLIAAAADCPVIRTLRKRLVFTPVEAGKSS